MLRLFTVAECKQTANSHSTTRQFKHSSNVECGKIVRNSPAFEFEFELRQCGYMKLLGVVILGVGVGGTPPPEIFGSRAFSFK